ncbi:LysE family translocator [Calidifontibacter sp. DB0510]|uniref:LysE family translocator n=1 Tax=Metallococcus carri TaxID=1656884 RepID=A0A967E9R6_9MICO|nr:LysE family translocator [Metallococcus carri]NHN55114.1 LysE family translocator [Metallococcus carri]NOP36191.1 LysE family translocator [Calidifontibacter sp. DB2511S]
MEQFVAVALAHFLALLIPGVDFFLIVRTAAAHGWRLASGVCLGIAIANGVFIAAAFGGLSLVGNDVVLAVVELAGGLFLLWMGVAFWRARVSVPYDESGSARRTSWSRSFGLGLASGLLNPKNLLFYLSLAAATSSAATAARALYGVWMFTVVLVWDLLVAGLMGASRNRRALSAALPWITRVAAVVVAVFGAAAIVAAARILLG